MTDPEAYWSGPGRFPQKLVCRGEVRVPLGDRLERLEYHQLLVQMCMMEKQRQDGQVVRKLAYGK